MISGDKVNNLTRIINKNSVIFRNFTYMTILEVFSMLAPLITYPYLVKVLGTELYGYVITAQILTSYFSIFIVFGFRNVSARHISIHKKDKSKISEILSTIFFVRLRIWILSFIIYLAIVYFIPSYKNHFLLFLFAFGLTLQDLLFPRFYFQGIEEMKFITLINVVIKSIFIILVFIFINDKNDYILAPLFMSIGFFIGGLYSLYIIIFKHKIKWKKPSKTNLAFYTKDAIPIFATNVVSSIKDKLSYILLGSLVGMHEVVIFDLGSKFTNILVKPTTLMSTVLLPKIARERNTNLFKKAATLSFLSNILIISVFNLFLPQIVGLFLPNKIELFPIRLFLLAPILLSLSSLIATNNIIALGYNKYIFHGIIITSIVYIVSTGFMYHMKLLDSVLVFISLTVIAYLVELIYRIIIANKILKIEGNRNRNVLQ